MPDDSTPPPEQGDSSLNVAAWHLQVLLTSLAGFDGKIMFLTALNVAGVSALVGLVATSDPSWWLVGLGLSRSGLCIGAGLGSLWAPPARQFPSPMDAKSTDSDEAGSNEQAQLYAIREAVLQADPALRRKLLLTRVLLLMTPCALAIVVATAIIAVR